MSENTAAGTVTRFAIERRIRAALGSGQPLPSRLRASLERLVGIDLDAVRLHTGAEADWLTGLLSADAVTAGSDIFFRPGAYSPETEDGLALLGHELGHVLANATAGAGRSGGVRVDRSEGAELFADRVAAQVLRGEPRAPSGAVARPVSEEQELVLRCHASWEHRLLGDAPAVDLQAIAQRLPARQQLLTDLRDFLYMWHQNPQAVTQAQINARYPYIRTLRLTTSGLLVTYGELNTLPDYLASPEAMDGLPANILLPILQAVRQEGYNKVQAMLGGSTASFKGSVAINTGWSIVDLLWETRAVDKLTINLGPNGTDHYTALVARNACHFAPYSWYRWQTFYTIARAKALGAFQTQDPAAKARLTRQAWVNLGYADHFLQDSFAAGHLVNKTQIMQWFIDWAADKWYVPVADWPAVSQMTVARQPGLSAQGLYNQANPGTVFDPQTAEEQDSRQARMDTCGVQADGGTQQAAYLNYLAFLNSTVVQASSGALHDYFNAKSVWAASVAQPAAFQLWGDDTMLNGGNGVFFASQTAHTSQQSIVDLLATGQTAVTVQQVFDMFPTQVSSTGPTGLQSLQNWNNGLQAVANTLFPQVNYYVLRAYPSIGRISVDQPANVLSDLLAQPSTQRLLAATPAPAAV